MNIIHNGNITTVPGIRAAGVHCGIKSKGRDLGIIVSDTIATSAGMFTTNKVKAAPVLLSEALIKNGKTKAVIVNSGNANACTGTQGYKDAEETLKIASSELDIPYKQFLIASTGKIGEKLPMEPIKKGLCIAKDKLSYSGGREFSESIVTTDNGTKTTAVQYEMAGKKIYIGASAKGAGMIHPNMATMLSFITTNIAIGKADLKRVLKLSVEESYNMITVDGCRSTNDSVICLANGLAGNTKISGDGFEKFIKALTYVNIHLAKMIVMDGEGATKLIEIAVSGAKSREDAKCIGLSIANSNLVKTAFFGEDPNWGRIISAAGSSAAGKSYNFEKIDISFDDCIVVKSGVSASSNKEKLDKILSKREIRVTVDLKSGKSSKATVWTSDLNHEYIRINSEYST